MKTPTPIVDSCEGSADRFGDRDVIPASVGRELERERNLWRNCAEAYRRSQTMKHFAAQDEIFDALEEQFPQL